MGYEYRVTKHDPAKRDDRDVYLADEWIMFTQIGSIVGGRKLTLAEYQRTENAYVETAVRFLAESGSQSVTVRHLEDPHGHAARMNVHEGCKLDHGTAIELMRLILRDLAWCKLDSTDGFVHFGRDYYMYVGVPIACDESRALAKEHGLFVEDCPSPYRDRSGF